MELYKKNVACIAEYPDVFDCNEEDADGDNFEFCILGQEQPNILDKKSGQLVYGQMRLDEIWEDARGRVSRMEVCLAVGDEFQGKSTVSQRVTSPHQTKLYDALYECGPMKGKDSFLVNRPGDYLPCVRAYGIGLGYHILHLITSRSVDNLVIVEPEVGIFLASCHTVPWWMIHEYFVNRGGRLKAIVGYSPKAAARKSSAFMNEVFRFYVNGFFRLKLFDSKKINEQIAEDNRHDGIVLQENSMGWYEDQRAGLFFSIKNFLDRVPALTERCLSSGRVFVVGNGPSLDESIDYIKSHVNDAVIFSCGSSLFTLLRNGIVPDFQIIQERFWYDFEERLDSETLKSISLIMLNPVTHKARAWYKKSFLILKRNDPGVSLWNEDYPVLGRVNPSVTNTAIALCKHLKIAEVFLFGCDYGKPKDGLLSHAAGGYYDDLKDDYGYDDSISGDIIFDGALSGKVVSDHFLSMSREQAERNFETSPWVNWFRVGNGAAVSGVTALAVRDLPETFDRTINKEAMIIGVEGCFSAAYAECVDIGKTSDLLKRDIEHYFEGISRLICGAGGIASKKEIIALLERLTQSLDLAQGSLRISEQLFSGGVLLFALDVYLQVILSESDAQAVDFFSKSLEVLAGYLSDISKDAVDVVDAAMLGLLDDLPSGSLADNSVAQVEKATSLS